MNRKNQYLFHLDIRSSLLCTREVTKDDLGFAETDEAYRDAEDKSEQAELNLLRNDSVAAHLWLDSHATQYIEEGMHQLGPDELPFEPDQRKVLLEDFILYLQALVSPDDINNHVVE